MGGKRLNIEQMHALAESKGGKCLSTIYINSQKKLKWECKYGHKWKALPSSIKNSDRWCPECGGSKKLTIEDMHALAESKGGKCLSTIYINANSKIKWECEFGHKWEATPGSIKGGSWCPECVGLKKLTIEEMYDLAESRGGKCLSKKYVGAHSKLKWECKCGYQWETAPNNIKQGSWCPECVGNKKLTIEEMHVLAESRGGKCLSNKYKGCETKIEWECELGHQWEATPSNIKRGTWCPICSSGIGERICKAFFEQLFDYKFQKAHPDWLRNKEGKKLELDGYNEKIKIAFEHQGIQHFQICHYTKTKKDLLKTKRDDKIKIDLCKEHGINLIVVPEIPRLLKIEDVKKFIKKECKKHKINLPNNFDNINIDLSKTYIKEDPLEEFKKIAESRGGKCLSMFYINTNSKLKWECKCGYQWESTPDSIKRGSWCPECGGSKKLTIEDMYFLAESRGGKCLSTTYINIHSKIKWECEFGHQWETAPDSIKRGTWCPICAIKKGADAQRGTIEEMHALAKEKSGKCLSTTYINIHSKLKWQCKCGHQWEAVPISVKNNGTWCPICAIKNRADANRGTIEEMHALAESKGGKCLSKKYIHSQTKLKWQCKCGYIWFAKPNNIKINIKQGKWCPECGGSKKLTIEQMHILAESRGGKCLSDKYTGCETKLKWECKFGHQWEAIPNNIKNGRWCPKCGKKRAADANRGTIEEMYVLAESKGGKCLSKEYISNNSKLEWECKCGHQWEAIPNSIKKGSWCPECVGLKKLTIEQMHALAESKGGKCLSKEYVSSNSKLEWQCKCGHQWEAIPNSVKQGSWCPKCSKQKSKEGQKG
jgi:hypothetical protein